MLRIAGGEAEALEEVHRKYRAIIKSVIMNVLFDDSEADDVAQEVLLQIWNKPGSYSAQKGKLGSWICTLARRRAIDRLRHNTSYRRMTDRYETTCKHETATRGESGEVEKEAMGAELREILMRHLGMLPPKQEEAVRMAYIENRSQREISALTNTPLGTIKTRIELGMKKLASAMSSLESEMR